MLVARRGTLAGTLIGRGAVRRGDLLVRLAWRDDAVELVRDAGAGHAIERAVSARPAEGLVTVVMLTTTPAAVETVALA